MSCKTLNYLKNFWNQIFSYSIEKYNARKWGNTRKGYWRIADSPILKVAINNDSLRKAGYPTLMGSYLEWHPK